MGHCYRCNATSPLAELPPGAEHQLCVGCKGSINDWFWTEVN
jgi:hypothetical protein